MSTVKTFKKGEALYKEGDKAQTIYLIQSGSVSLQLVRQKQTIELCTLGGMQIIGEHALSGAASHPHSAVARAEVKAIELSVEAVRTQLESATQIQKLLMKSLGDKLKVVMKDCQSMRLERDNTPCPADQTAKIFGVVYHVAKIKGEPPPEAPRRGKLEENVKPAMPANTLVVNWLNMRQYAQRVFLESPLRMQNAINILVKLGWAKYDMVKPEDNPDGPEEIGSVQFYDLPVVEQFFEFFQYYHFKGGKQELLKTDDRAIHLVRMLLELGASETLDRHGAARIDYTRVVEKVKSATGGSLDNGSWTILETKGLLVKRQSNDDGIFLHFDLKEFERTEKIWRILREVERWNERGSVDPAEAVAELKLGHRAEKANVTCPDCGHAFEVLPKFCSECGAKIVAAA